MIKSWHKFNESQSNKLTKEMAQEIIYYVSEDSKPTESIVDDIYDLINNNDDSFTMYETGYDDMKEMIKKLLNMCQNNPELTDKMIQIYHRIREEREIFPEAFEIEEIFSDFMDLEDFDFMIYSDNHKYQIKLNKWTQVDLPQFIKYSEDVNKYLYRLKSPDYETKLVRCEFTNYHRTIVQFEIELKSKNSND
jgi:hypothetical protein